MAAATDDYWVIPPNGTLITQQRWSESWTSMNGPGMRVPSGSEVPEVPTDHKPFPRKPSAYPCRWIKAPGLPCEPPRQQHAAAHRRTDVPRDPRRTISATSPRLPLPRASSARAINSSLPSPRASPWSRAVAPTAFSLLTGATKFSPFARPDNLNASTPDARYSAICGYIERDVDTVLAPELDGLDLYRVRQSHYCHNWVGDERVFNPSVILLLFEEQEIGDSWFETGTPKVLLPRNLPMAGTSFTESGTHRASSSKSGT